MQLIPMSGAKNISVDWMGLLKSVHRCYSHSSQSISLAPKSRNAFGIRSARPNSLPAPLPEATRTLQKSGRPHAHSRQCMREEF